MSMQQSQGLAVSCRGVASLAYAAGAGSSGLLYSVGADCMVCGLDAGSGAQVGMRNARLGDGVWCYDLHSLPTMTLQP